MTERGRKLAPSVAFELASPPAERRAQNLETLGTQFLCSFPEKKIDRHPSFFPPLVVELRINRQQAELPSREPFLCRGPDPFCRGDATSAEEEARSID